MKTLEQESFPGDGVWRVAICTVLATCAHGMSPRLETPEAGHRAPRWSIAVLGKFKPFGPAEEQSYRVITTPVRTVRRKARNSTRFRSTAANSLGSLSTAVSSGVVTP